jgi:hypothetical protein
MKELTYYFAYGSNLLIRRFASRVGRYGPVVEGTPYKLKGWTLAFNAGSKIRNGLIFANIVPGDAQDVVEGVLYSLNHYQFAALDTYELLYKRLFFNVEMNGQEFLACTYVAHEEFTKPKSALPELEYLNTMLDGTKEYGLKDTYNILVEFKNKHYKLKGGNRHKPML